MTHITLNLPEVESLEAFKAASKKLLTNYRTLLRGQTSNFTKVPVKFSESAKIDISLDNNRGVMLQSITHRPSQLTIKAMPEGRLVPPALRSLCRCFPSAAISITGMADEVSAACQKPLLKAVSSALA